MYHVTLYCSDSACDAVFEAHGSLEAVAAAVCPFCGCTLGELTFVPVGEAAETDEDSPLEDLEIWAVHGPVTRRLRRRRRARKRLAKAA